MNTINALFDWMLTAGLRASLLVPAVLGAQWFMKNRLPSRWRYALWLPVLAALLLPGLPVLPSWMQWPEARVSKQAPSLAPAAAVPTSGLPERVMVPLLRDPAVRENVPAPSSVPQIIKPVTPDAPESGAVRAWLSVTWLAGAAATVLFVMTSFARTMRRIRRSSLAVEGDLLSQVGGTAREVGLRRMPRVLKSSAVSSPAVCGLWRPVLLLNDRFPQDFSAEEADMVLRHELTHIRRGDLPLNALLCALLALHWWNPLLWFAFHRARADREAACDAEVLNGATAARRAAYGHTLLKLETGFPPSGLCLGFVGIIQRGGTLRGRIHAIISQPQLNPIMKTATLFMITLLTAAGIATATDEEKPASPPRPGGAAGKPVKEDVPKKADTAAVVKLIITELPESDREADAKAEFAAAELQIKDLWNLTGLQLFELTRGPDSVHELFTLYSGKLTILPIPFAHGFATAFVDNSGTVYLTSEAGSGIATTTLHKLSRTTDAGGLTSFGYEELGIIASRPAGNEDRDVVGKMKDVIAKLKPVELGTVARGPAKTEAEAAPSRAVDPEQIKGRIAVKRGGEISATLKADGEQLQPAAPGEKANPDDITVRIAIQETTATPFPVPDNATRPFLAISHNSQKPLQFRALARLKGSREFYEIEGPLEPVDSGDAMTAIHCWESGAALEEVVLYQFTAAPGAGAGETATAVTRQPGKDGTSYYHLRYILTPENCELSLSNEQRPPKYGGSNAYTFEQGGQFEVFIRASAFPVPVETPDNQPGFMILRMPSTNADELKADQNIAGKRSLFDRIKQMKTEGRGSVEVAIQLENVEVLTEQPLSVKMRGINVYFRQAFGRYIDYTGPLKKEDRGD